ncbi:MAG: protein kinase family protein [Streptosporangiaceae bacterium]
MSTYTSEPGTRLAGRYRLVDQVDAGAGWTYWKATDETLARFVTVLTFAAGFPRVTETVTAARAASRLGDPRFSQVFDVEDADELAYVVLEWVVGESLLDMLSEGPLDPLRAAALMAEAARAIANAHDGGLAHLRLDPACLHWTPGGGVKIAGLGIDAALAGPDLTAAEDGADDPELTDTRDLARLLYAALTGYWPGHQGFAGSAPGLLPPAPENDGGPCTPRQVSAGVPASIDDVTCRALFQQPNRHGPALSTAAMFADALTSAAPPMPPPAAAATLSDSPATRGYGYQPDGSARPYPPGTSPRTTIGGGRKPPVKRSAGARAVISAVIVLVLAAVGVAAWSFSRSPHHSSAAPPTTSPRSSSPAAAASVLLKPVSATSFNPLGSPPGSNEDSGETGNAIDGNASTFWHTSYYDGNPVFGGLKKGTGLLLDMGRAVRLSQVAVQFGTTCCDHVQIEIGNDSNPVASALSSFTVLQSSDTAQGNTTFNVTSNATGRYVLIWLTYLPALTGSPNQYEAQIYNVVVRGSAAGQSG